MWGSENTPKRCVQSRIGENRCPLPITQRPFENYVLFLDGLYFVLLLASRSRILVSDATVQNVGFKNPTYDAARE